MGKFDIAGQCHVVEVAGFLVVVETGFHVDIEFTIGGIGDFDVDGSLELL